MRTCLFYAVLFLSGNLLFTSCKKDDPSSETETPVFHANGTLNGASFFLSAGVNNYYMYSSYSSDVLDIYEYSGVLKPKDCSGTCPKSMEVHIRDYSPHTSQATNINTALSAGMYSFAVPSTSSGYLVNFTSQAAGDSVISYSWTFGDNTSSTLPNPTHTYAIAGVYYVCLDVNYTHNSSACSNSFCDTLILGSTPCMQTSFSITPVPPGDSLQFTPVVTGGTPPYVFSWNFGDVSGTQQGTVVEHDYIPAGAYTVSLFVSDANSCTVSKRLNILSANYNSCLTNFTWQQQTAPLPDLSKVSIQWTDASGNVYTSADTRQPANSTFEILSVEEYQLNENQQHTKKVHMRVNCTLYNGANTLLLENADLVFALAYP